MEAEKVYLRRSARCLVVTVATAAMVFLPIVAFAAYPGGTDSPSPTVGGEKFNRGGLTRTGTDLRLYLLIALLAVVAGIALRKVTRASDARSDD